VRGAAEEERDFDGSGCASWASWGRRGGDNKGGGGGKERFRLWRGIENFVGKGEQIGGTMLKALIRSERMGGKIHTHLACGERK